MKVFLKDNGTFALKLRPTITELNHVSEILIVINVGTPCRNDEMAKIETFIW